MNLERMFSRDVVCLVVFALAFSAGAAETRINAIGEKSREEIVAFFTDNEFGRRPVAYGGFSLRMDPMVRGFSMEGVGGSPSADKNVGGPKGMTAVRLVDPANGHGVEVKVF